MSEPSASGPQYELIVVAQQASSHMPALLGLMRSIAGYLAKINFLGADLYYRRQTDVALVALRIDARVATRPVIAGLVDHVSRAGFAVLEPARLPEEERRRFRDAYLPTYDLRVGQLPSADDAIRLLAEQLGLVASAGGPPAAPRVRQPRPSDRLEVRFRRGDEWHLGRARSLTREAIYVSTGGPPRCGDVVDLLLTLASARVVARAAVVHVTPAETAAALGSAGFGARFLVSEGAERARVEEFLAKVRTASLPDLTPPPRRRDVRYPVRWPVAVGTTTTAALDVSRHGMFVALDAMTRAGGEVEVAMALDDSGPPVRARARVARAISPQEGRARGVATGVGLELGALPARDESRFLRFLHRVGRRAERCIVVGASPQRAAALTAELVGAGYNASAATDPPSLVSRAAAAARAPDLVMLDASLAQADPRAHGAVRRALAVRSVPTLYVDEESPASARSLADVALLS